MAPTRGNNLLTMSASTGEGNIARFQFIQNAFEVTLKVLVYV